MKTYQRNFIEFALACEALRFGDFTLKSGRKSSYFFNAGLFNTSHKIRKLGEYYAKTIQAHFQFGKDYNILFGPAYKGIPIAIATSIALSHLYDIDIPYAFNRKEDKDYGEGGRIIGSPLQGKVLIIDDVMTAGTVVRESMAILNACNATLAGVIIALDRQEVGPNGNSAIAEVEQHHQAPVKNIISLENIITYLDERKADTANFSHYVTVMKSYSQRYGIKDLQEKMR